MEVGGGGEVSSNLSWQKVPTNSVAYPDPHQIERYDPDPDHQQSDKLDPDPHKFADDKQNVPYLMKFEPI